jgi:hypothetical protein
MKEVINKKNKYEIERSTLMQYFFIGLRSETDKSLKKIICNIHKY